MRTAWVCGSVSPLKQIMVIHARLCRTATSAASKATDYSCQQQQHHNLNNLNQQRNFAWHAGLIEESIADEIMDEIKSEHTQLIKLIDEELTIASSSSSSSSSSSFSSSLSSTTTLQEVMNTILKREHNILQLRQRYKELTGDDVDDDNYDDDDDDDNSAFNDSAAVQTITI
jgi:hypothetical protein